MMRYITAYTLMVVGLYVLLLVLSGCTDSDEPFRDGTYIVDLEWKEGDCGFYHEGYNVQTEWYLVNIGKVWTLHTLAGNLYFTGAWQDTDTLLFHRGPKDDISVQQNFVVTLWPEGPEAFSAQAVAHSEFVFVTGIKACTDVWAVYGGRL